MYKYSRRKDLEKATEEEAARIRGKNERIMDEAQAIADKEYEEEKAQYEADLKRRVFSQPPSQFLHSIFLHVCRQPGAASVCLTRAGCNQNKEGMSQFWNLLWYGDETGPPPPPPPKEKKAGWHRKVRF